MFAGVLGQTKNPLVLKLARFAPLSQDDVFVLDELCRHTQRFAAHVRLSAEGEPPRPAFAVMRGLACRYRLLPDGRRQIIGFLLPGDFNDLYEFLFSAADHSIGTIVPTWLVAIERDKLFELVMHHPRISTAVWWSTMQDAAIMRERVVTLGRRNARGRVAYLFCEFLWRYLAVAMADDHTIRLPLTQAEIADSLGLTSVHVNRVLQEFRREGLITLDRDRLSVLDIKALQLMAQFSQSYLHYGKAPVEALRYIEQLRRDRKNPPGGGR